MGGREHNLSHRAGRVLKKFGNHCSRGTNICVVFGATGVSFVARLFEKFKFLEMNLFYDER
jgi:hypothetical protein